jgi:uncharacterized membrane protein YgdD (TMEM256/DUF423 family)
MDRLFFVLGSLSGLISVAAGAFGAHALRPRLAPEFLSAFETAASYQMYHALALLAAAWAASRWPGKKSKWAGWCFVVGTLLFSGSLYMLALTGTRWLGAITPLGGTAFMAGWLCLAWSALTRPPATTERTTPQ